MEVGSAEHEIGAGLANLRAIHHEPHVGGFHVLSAGLQAVIHGGFVADVVAFQAKPDALFHCGVHVMHD